MLYANVEQGLRCDRLKVNKERAEMEVRNWENHVPRLRDKIRFEQGRLDNLRRQLERIGDISFATDIKNKEDEIAKLERQIVVAENNAQEWRERAAEIVAELGRNDCSGYGYA